MMTQKPQSKPNTKTEATRLALLDAGIEVFGRVGFDGASNRELAKKAGVNLALISYHFGGKEGLYLAVFEYIRSQMQQRMEPVAVEILQELAVLQSEQHGLEAHVRIERAIHLMQTLLFAFVDMLASKQTEPWAKLILNEQQEPTEAFNIIYTGVMSKKLALLTQLVAIALQKDQADREVKLCAMSLVGQVQSLRSARAVILQHMAWETISETEISLIKQQLSAFMRALFLGVAISSH